MLHGHDSLVSQLLEVDHWKIPSGLWICAPGIQASENSFGLKLASHSSGKWPRHLITALTRLSSEMWQQEPVISWSTGNCTLACVGGPALNYKDWVQCSEQQQAAALGSLSQNTKARCSSNSDRWGRREFVENESPLCHDFSRLMPPVGEFAFSFLYFLLTQVPPCIIDIKYKSIFY